MLIHRCSIRKTSFTLVWVTIVSIPEAAAYDAEVLDILQFLSFSINVDFIEIKALHHHERQNIWSYCSGFHLWGWSFPGCPQVVWNDFITVVEALADNLCYSFSLRLFQLPWGSLWSSSLVLIDTGLNSVQQYCRYCCKRRGLLALSSGCPEAVGLQDEGLLGNTDYILTFSELLLLPANCFIYAASADRNLGGRWYCLCYFA